MMVMNKAKPTEVEVKRLCGAPSSREHCWVPVEKMSIATQEARARGGKKTGCLRKAQYRVNGKNCCTAHLGLTIQEARNDSED